MRVSVQPFGSIFRAVWQYADPESSIHHVTWSVRVHHDYQGHQPVDPVYVTSATEGVKANLALNDGDKYFLTLNACNGAGMCQLAEEVGFLLCCGAGQGMAAAACCHECGSCSCALRVCLFIRLSSLLLHVPPPFCNCSRKDD